MGRTKEVTVITGLVTETALLHGWDYRYHTYDKDRTFDTGEGLIEFDQTQSFKENIVPICRFRFGENAGSDKFIVYTKEVERLLNTPINALKDRAEMAEESLRRAAPLLVLEQDKSDKLSRQLNKFQTMSFWKRFKFLFTGKASI